MCASLKRTMDIVVGGKVVCVCGYGEVRILSTVEPPNKGHFGANSFVPCREVSLSRW